MGEWKFSKIDCNNICTKLWMIELLKNQIYQNQKLVLIKRHL